MREFTSLSASMSAPFKTLYKGLPAAILNVVKAPIELNPAPALILVQPLGMTMVDMVVFPENAPDTIHVTPEAMLNVPLLTFRDWGTFKRVERESRCPYKTPLLSL